MPKPDCSPLAKLIAQLALKVGELEHVKTLDDVVAELQKHIPEIDRKAVVDSINEAHRAGPRTISDLKKKLGELKREAKNDKALTEKIAALEKNLTEGTLPAKRAAAPEPPDKIAALRVQRDELLAMLRKSEPALRERFEKKIADLTERLDAGDFTPRPKEQPSPLSADLERLAYQRDRLRAQIRQRTEALKPRTFWQKATTVAAEPMNLARTLLTSFDLSAVLRQGGVFAFGHPIKAAKVFRESIRAAVSPVKAHAINEEILNRPNAPQYAQSGLYLAPIEGGSLTAKEEAFLSRFAEKLPVVGTGVRFSQRAYVTHLNRFRADQFDAMKETIGRNGDLTAPEAKAVAHFVNVATGRGDLGKLAGSAEALNALFFSPRYLTSRLQLLSGEPIWRAPTWRVRKAIAAEYAKTLTGLGVFLGLGVAAGGTIETDPRSSDFGKIKIGDTRIDPWMGLQQFVVLGSRLATGETKKTTGQVVPIRGKVPFGGQKADDLLKNFFRSKLAPGPGLIYDVAKGEHFGGEPVTAGSVARQMLVPMSYGDIYEVMKEHGVPKGAALGILNLFGMNVQTYEQQRGSRRAPAR